MDVSNGVVLLLLRMIPHNLLHINRFLMSLDMKEKMMQQFAQYRDFCANVLQSLQCQSDDVFEGVTKRYSPVAPSGCVCIYVSVCIYAYVCMISMPCLYVCIHEYLVSKHAFDSGANAYQAIDGLVAQLH